MIAALVVLVLLAWLIARFLGYRRPRADYLQLSRYEAAFLTAAADAAFPPGGAIPLSGTEAGVPAYVDRYLDVLPRRTRILMRLLFLMFEHVTLIFPGPGIDGWRRFSTLRPEQRMALLESWGNSRLRMRRIVFQSLRTILTMAYLACPEVLRRMELAPLAIESPVVDADLLYPRIGASRSTIPWRPEDRERIRERGPLDPQGPLHADFAGTGS